MLAREPWQDISAQKRRSRWQGASARTSKKRESSQWLPRQQPTHVAAAASLPPTQPPPTPPHLPNPPPRPHPRLTCSVCSVGLNLQRMGSNANLKPASLSRPSIRSTASPLQPKLHWRGRGVTGSGGTGTGGTGSGVAGSGATSSSSRGHKQPPDTLAGTGRAPAPAISHSQHWHGRPVAVAVRERTS